MYGKAEFFNPGGSVKDRIGLPMIEQFEQDGTLKPGGTIVEGTSGNTGVGLAIAAALKGYRCIFTMPDKMSPEKVRLLKAFGAEVIITPTAVPPDHPDSYTSMAKRIAAETPNAVLAEPVLQSGEPAGALRHHGPRALGADGGADHALRRRRGDGRDDHRRGALPQGEEPEDADRRRRSAWDRSSRRPGARTARRSRRGRPTRWRGSGRTRSRARSTSALIDEFQTVSDRDAFAMARRLTREEGLFVGGSAGLIAHAALSVARRINDPEACVVTVLCDTGERYLSKVFNDEWMQENQLLDAEKMTLGQLLAAKGGEIPALVSTAPGASVRQALGLMTPAQRVAAPGDGRPELRGLGERERAQRARASRTPRCSSGR